MIAGSGSDCHGILGTSPGTATDTQPVISSAAPTAAAIFALCAIVQSPKLTNDLRAVGGGLCPGQPPWTVSRLGLHITSALEGPAEGDLIGVLQITTNGQATREPGDPDPHGHE